MVGLVLKAGFLFVVVMSLLGSTQDESIPDMIAVFLANGVIPGTNVIIPPEVMLVTAALGLMVIASAISRIYAKQQASMRALIPDYDDYKHDPPLTELVPALGRLMATLRSMRLRASFAMPGYWARYSARPADAQAITRRNTVNVVMRLDRWAPVRIRIRLPRLRNLVKAGPAILRSLRFRVQAYLLRVSML
ncbi:hypothetical protein IRY61_04945 [Candidatus Saccharibacteria bacterium]|nr:hypothetical protein [Candidatus Saccharibacteria bacterium]